MNVTVLPFVPDHRPLRAHASVIMLTSATAFHLRRSSLQATEDTNAGPPRDVSGGKPDRAEDPIAEVFSDITSPTAGLNCLCL